MLRQSEQELRLIADAMPVLIGYADSSRCFQFLNKTAERWFARPSAELLGSPIPEVIGGGIGRGRAAADRCRFGGGTSVL